MYSDFAPIPIFTLLSVAIILGVLILQPLTKEPKDHFFQFSQKGSLWDNFQFSFCIK